MPNKKRTRTAAPLKIIRTLDKRFGAVEMRDLAWMFEAGLQHRAKVKLVKYDRNGKEAVVLYTGRGSDEEIVYAVRDSMRIWDNDRKVIPY